VFPERPRAHILEQVRCPRTGDLEDMVPLSDHEQRLLEQMEQALYAEDPKFASVLQGDDLRLRYRRRLVVAVLGFIAGLALLLVGVSSGVVFSVIGFLVMLASVLAGVSAYNRTPRGGETASANAEGGAVIPIRSGGRQRKGLMDRVEERWQRRRDELGR